MHVCVGMLPCTEPMSHPGCVPGSHPVLSVVYNCVSYIGYTPEMPPVDNCWSTLFQLDQGFRWKMTSFLCVTQVALVLPQLSRSHPLPGATCCSAGVMQFKCKSGRRDRDHDTGHHGTGHPQGDGWWIEFPVRPRIHVGKTCHPWDIFHKPSGYYLLNPPKFYV